jgi:hypothetical protein
VGVPYYGIVQAASACSINPLFRHSYRPKPGN